MSRRRWEIASIAPLLVILILAGHILYVAINSKVDESPNVTKEVLPATASDDGPVKTAFRPSSNVPERL